MISVNINVPFQIGDIVEYEHEEYELGAVTCPFCRGRGYINFGIKEYNIGKSKDSSGLMQTPMIRKCKNCENGTITYIKGISVKKEDVMVNGISVYMPGGFSDISVMQNGGTNISVPQHTLKVKNKKGENIE